MLFIAPPALHRGAIDRLADLAGAGRADRSLRPIELQAALVPGQVAVVQDAPRLALEILDQVFILYFQHGTLGQHPPPMIHEVQVPAIMPAKLAQFVGEGQVALVETKEEARKTCVHGVAANMDAPNPDSGEEFTHVNTQLFGLIDPPGNRGIMSEQMTAPFNAPGDPHAVPTMDGFVADYISMFTAETGGQISWGSCGGWDSWKSPR